MDPWQNEFDLKLIFSYLHIVWENQCIILNKISMHLYVFFAVYHIQAISLIEVCKVAEYHSISIEKTIIKSFVMQQESA